MSWLYLSDSCAFFVYFRHTAMRAQSAPGFPCALSSEERDNEMQNPGKSIRGNERVCLATFRRSP